MAKVALAREMAGTESEVARKTLTGAVVKAGELLGLSQGDLAQVLGLSGATVSRMAGGRYALQPERKEWQLAALFIRLFRSLDSITGGHDELSRTWLESFNDGLGAIPKEMLGDLEKLVSVVQYLDRSRARV